MFGGRGPMKRAKKYFEPAYQSTKKLMLKNTVQDAEKVLQGLLKAMQREQRSMEYLEDNESRISII